MPDPKTPNDYLADINTAVSGKTGEDAAQAILDTGKEAYRTAESADSGHGQIELQKYQTALQTYINQNGAKGIAGADGTVAALAAQKQLQGFQDSGWDWATQKHHLNGVSISEAQTTFSNQFDHRTQDQVSASVIQSLGATGFDPANVAKATAILKGMPASELKTLDQNLMSLRNISGDNGVDAAAAQYAGIVRNSNSADNTKNPFNQVLNVLGQQQVNPADGSREIAVKGMLAGSDKGNGSTVERAVKDISSQVKYGGPMSTQAAASPPPPQPGAAGPPGAKPAGDASAVIPAAKADDIQTNFASGSATLSAAEGQKLEEAFKKRFQAEKKAGHSSLKASFLGSADNTGTADLNKSLEDQRIKVEMAIAQKAAGEAGVTLTGNNKSTVDTSKLAAGKNDQARFARASFAP